MILRETYDLNEFRDSVRGPEHVLRYLGNVASLHIEAEGPNPLLDYIKENSGAYLQSQAHETPEIALHGLLLKPAAATVRAINRWRPAASQDDRTTPEQRVLAPFRVTGQLDFTRRIFVELPQRDGVSLAQIYDDRTREQLNLAQKNRNAYPQINFLLWVRNLIGDQGPEASTARLVARNLLAAYGGASQTSEKQVEEKMKIVKITGNVVGTQVYTR